MWTNGYASSFIYSYSAFYECVRFTITVLWFIFTMLLIVTMFIFLRAIFYENKQFNIIYITQYLIIVAMHPLLFDVSQFLTIAIYIVACAFRLLQLRSRSSRRRSASLGSSTRWRFPRRALPSWQPSSRTSSKHATPNRPSRKLSSSARTPRVATSRSRTEGHNCSGNNFIKCLQNANHNFSLLIIISIHLQ